MARARNIKPALFKNELLGVADPLLTILFQSLWTLADKEGRLEDRPLRIKAETFPYRDSLDVNGYLTELQRMGFIVRYTVGLAALIQVVNFKKHQTPHNTEKASELPSVEAGIVATCGIQEAFVKSPLSDGENVNALPPDSFNLIPDSPILIPDAGSRAGAPAESFPIPDGLLADFMKVRKAKRAGPLTDTAIKGIQREADKAGISLENAVTACCEFGWQGFNADWYAERSAKKTPGQTTSKASPGKHTGFQNLDYKIGINDDGSFS